MSRYSSNREFQHGQSPKVGVLLCNLGTPDAPTPSAVRRYLAEFLSDPRVVEIPRALWLIILHGVILRLRPRRSAAAYAKVWSDDGSPLLAISKRQATALTAELQARHGDHIEVQLAMRYGEPSIASGLRELRRRNVRKILILPAYPQYAGATTASVFDAVSAELTTWRWIPELRFVTEYHANAAYIEALAESLNAYWRQHGRGEQLLMSFHGTPKRSLEAGDPYHCQCHATARLLAEHLELPNQFWQVTFQSRFGRAEWLQPYTEASLKQCASDGVKKVDVICPGFAADCLETLEEIALQYAGIFQQAGGQQLRYVPALNDRDSHIKALAAIVDENLGGWALAPSVEALGSLRAAANRAEAMSTAAGVE